MLGLLSSSRSSSRSTERLDAAERSCVAMHRLAQLAVRLAIVVEREQLHDACSERTNAELDELAICSRDRRRRVDSMHQRLIAAALRAVPQRCEHVEARDASCIELRCDAQRVLS